MKIKMIKLYFIVIGLFLTPMIVLAEEGVHYFLTYPNGEEIVTTNYEEATNPKERLIYAGRTNDNGDIVLEGYSQVGELRIVQKVPIGYSTEKREITLDLSQTNRTVEFVDFRGTVNPETGQSLLLIGVTVIILSVAAMIVVKGTGKKALFLILVGFLCFATFNIYAAEEDIVISIRDKEGKKLPGVEVEVYARPSRIESAPAIIFSANGGHFLDGKTEMIFRLPSSPCTFEEFENSLSENDLDYYIENSDSVYREGYYWDGYDYPEEDYLTDGTVISAIWEEEQEEEPIVSFHYHGNGGFYDFYGRKLTDFDLYNTSDILFERDGYIFMGYDDNASCTRFNESGVDTRPEGMIFGKKNDLYACWNDTPDGLYVDDEYFGTINNPCTQKFYGKENVVEIRYDANHVLYFYKIQQSMTRSSLSKSDIHTAQIIKNREVVVSLNENDLRSENDNYYITNEDKYTTFSEFFSCKAN